jgi:hypothetical protein
MSVQRLIAHPVYVVYFFVFLHLKVSNVGWQKTHRKVDDAFPCGGGVGINGVALHVEDILVVGQPSVSVQEMNVADTVWIHSNPDLVSNIVAKGHPNGL